jgi:hypothetical protein
LTATISQASETLAFLAQVISFIPALLIHLYRFFEVRRLDAALQSRLVVARMLQTYPSGLQTVPNPCNRSFVPLVFGGIMQSLR